MSQGPATAPLTIQSANEAAVGAVLDDIKGFRHNYWAPVLLGVIMLFDSWDSIAIAFAVPSLAAEWGLNPLEMGGAISAGYAGQFFGAFCLGALAERHGRMPILIGAIATMSVLAIACALTNDYRPLLAMRFIQGIAIGGAMPVAISYINELAPTKTRGRYFGMFQTLAISGFAAASLASPFIIPHLGWRWMLGLGFTPIVLLPLVWLTLPESPRWLARNGRLAAADKALAKLGGRAAFGGQAADGTAAPAGEPQPRVKLGALLSPEMRGRTLTITLLWLLTMFVSFGLTTWAPSIYVKSFHIPIDRAMNYSALASILIFLTLAVSGVLIDRFGRRPFAIGGLIVTGGSLLLLAATGATQEYVVATLVTIGKIAIFFGTYVLWPYTAETYPTNLRALALGYAASIGRGASMVTPLFVGFVLERGASISIVFGSFGLCALAATALWITRTSETAGRRLETI